MVIKSGYRQPNGFQPQQRLRQLHLRTHLVILRFG